MLKARFDRMDERMHTARNARDMLRQIESLEVAMEECDADFLKKVFCLLISFDPSDPLNDISQNPNFELVLQGFNSRIVLPECDFNDVCIFLDYLRRLQLDQQCLFANLERLRGAVNKIANELHKRILPKQKELNTENLTTCVECLTALSYNLGMRRPYLALQDLAFRISEQLQGFETEDLLAVCREFALSSCVGYSGLKGKKGEREMVLDHACAMFNKITDRLTETVGLSIIAVHNKWTKMGLKQGQRPSEQLKKDIKLHVKQKTLPLIYQYIDFAWCFAFARQRFSHAKFTAAPLWCETVIEVISGRKGVLCMVYNAQYLVSVLSCEGMARLLWSFATVGKTIMKESMKEELFNSSIDLFARIAREVKNRVEARGVAEYPHHSSNNHNDLPSTSNMDIDGGEDLPTASKRMKMKMKMKMKKKADSDMTFTLNQLVCILWSFAKLRLRSERLPEKVKGPCKTAVGSVLYYLADLLSQPIHNNDPEASSSSSSSPSLSSEWVHTYAVQTAKAPKEPEVTDEFGRSVPASAIRKSSYRPPPYKCLVQTLVESKRHEHTRLCGLDAGDVCDLVWSYAALGLRDNDLKVDQLFSCVNVEINARMKEFSQAQLERAAWAFTRKDQLETVAVAVGKTNSKRTGNKRKHPLPSTSSQSKDPKRMR